MKTVSLAVLILLFAVFPITGAEGVVAYEGTGQCDGMKVTVTFNYDRAAGKINDFVAAHSCIDGKGGIDLSVPPISVMEDGSFSFPKRVSGRIDKDGGVRGELGKGIASIQCADEKYYAMCTEFTAKPKKE